MFDRVNPKTIDAVLLKLLDRRFEIAVDRCVLLIQIGEIKERVVLQLVTIVPVRNISVVMEVSIGVVGVVPQQTSIVVERPVLAGVVLRRMVRRKVNDYLNPTLVRSCNQVIEVRPGIVHVTKMLFDPFEVASLIAMIRSSRI